MPSWTSEQLEAINKEGSNIIVSAGAGSGKTAVLTERVIRKLRDGVNIDHLLILTFTNAAAAEMKDRIRKAITKEKMYNQLDYIDSAYITTFDSYARSIVKKYYYLLNISSNINIIDDTVLDIVSSKTIDNIFSDYYGNNLFDNLISNFCEKDDTLIKKAILAINNKLDLRIDKESYLENYINNYYEEKYVNSLINEYEILVINKKNELSNILYNISILADGNFYSNLEDFLSNIINSNSYDELRNNLNIGRYPICRGATEELKSKYEELKKQIKVITDMCFYSKEELKSNLLSTKENVSIIIEIIRKLNNEINNYKKENDVYTFNDIAKMAIKIIKENDEVKNELINYYNEILVDEYQDTSDLQEEFINLISNNNVYMVGDIKQSIYRFRNANPNIFREKYNKYSQGIDGYKIDLLKNFRSREEVLNNINEIFDFVMDEKFGNAVYKKSHRMIFGNHVYDRKNEKQNYNLDILNYKKGEDYTKYSNEEIEAFIIGNDIKNKINNHTQIIDKETNTLRCMNYDDISIIMDRGTAFETYSKIFEYLSIPVVIWKDEVLTGEDDINIIKNIIGLIINIKNNTYNQTFKYYFMSIARSYLFSIDDNEIFNYFLNNNFKDSDIYKKCKEISLVLDELNNVDLLNMIIDEFNIYEKSITVGNVDKVDIRLNNLLSLFKSLSELGYTPYDLIDYFNDSSNSTIKYSLNTKVPGSVNLMNIHKSKGLEYSICYFSGFAKKFNDADLKDSFIYDLTYGIILPFYNDGIGNTILKDLFKDKYINEDISERIRLFYVALTRAKEKMIIVTSLDENNTEELSDSTKRKYNSFLSIMDSISDKVEKYISNVDLTKINLSKNYDMFKSSNYKELLDKKNNTIKHINIAIDNEEIENSHFSKVSHNLFSKEEIKNMEFGTYMHYLLETIDFKNPQINSKYEDKIKSFLNKLDLNNVNIFKEYEFIYEEDNNIKHGIIDLMLEYTDHIDIIDYKLKNTMDDNYYKQILGYKKYIALKTNKKVNTYLYSIMNEKFDEIK